MMKLKVTKLKVMKLNVMILKLVLLMQVTKLSTLKNNEFSSDDDRDKYSESDNFYFLLLDLSRQICMLEVLQWNPY